MNIDKLYTWFLLCSGSEEQPLVVLQGASSGEWEQDVARRPATDPVAFWVVSAGTLGSVVSTATGTLVSLEIADAISSACSHEVRVHPAVVAHPRDLLPPEPYVLLRPKRCMSIAQLTDSPGKVPDIAHVQESPTSIVVNLPLRLALEALRLPALAFEEPCFG